MLVLGPSHEFQCQTCVTGKRFMIRRVASGLGQALPDAIGGFTNRETFPLAARPISMADQSRGDDFGFIENKPVAGGEKFGQIAHRMMFDRPSGRADDQQSRVITLRQGILSDEIVGQVVFKKHQSDYKDGRITTAP
jgi:hypothetical protein